MELLYLVGLSVVALVAIFVISKAFSKPEQKVEKKSTKPVIGDPPKSMI